MAESIFERAKLALGVKTNKELAERLGQAESSVSGWKSRDAIPIDYLLIISKLSNVPVDWILRGDDSHFPSPPNAIAPFYQADDAIDKIGESHIDNMINSILKHNSNGLLKSNVVDRAKLAIDAKSDADLARYLDVSTPVVSGYQKRKNVPLEQCIKIAERTGVSLDWLILGKGSLKTTASGSLNDDDVGATVPLFDTPASAGAGSFFDAEHIIQQVPFDAGWLKREGLHIKDLVCLPIKGDSMSPALSDGDIVLVNRAVQRGEGVFVLRMHDALRIKRLQWMTNGQLRISSDNPIYEPETVTLKALEDFAILGFVHTKIGRVR